jgi:lysophospholipase L1-like esterase
MKVFVGFLLCLSLLCPKVMQPAAARSATIFAASNGGIAPVTAQQTLFLGDSITNDWSDEPVRKGYPGQHACVIRLHMATVLAANPQVKRLVIEAGTNDIIGGPYPGFACALPGLDPVTAILNMVRAGQAAGLEVFVMSVLPIAWTNRAGQPCNNYVPAFNQTLQTAITAQGAYWVDDWALFNGQTGLQPDGVHPNEAGYQLMEQAYEAAAAAAEGN